jgi:deoxyribodipyrimidine photo-lyase
MPTQVVWFKRDLRLHDHAPLCEAATRGPLLLLWVWEPSLIARPDSDLRHLQFQQEALLELEQDLTARGGQLLVRVGEMPEVLAQLELDELALWSHAETGHDGTYQRDRQVAAWCQARGVPWTELPQTGVVRRLKSRDGWARRWQERMSQPVRPAPERLTCEPRLDPGPRPTPESLWQAHASQPPLPMATCQPGGRRAAEQLLASFLTQRGRDYRSEMSTPLAGETGCSRLSPHFAWGTLSVREAWQATRARVEALRAEPRSDARKAWLQSLQSFEARLRWHCHFMQKLESEPEMEFRSLVPQYDGLRPANPERLAAWFHGRTGLPMVDAVMRCLHATGWVNFRMRAMVQSVAAYHLWLDWRETWPLLARLFTDYEPGIHLSQSQMQSGCTGMNTMRIYSPAKQLRDQDPDGVFVRRWLPELATVPTPWLAEPHRMPAELAAEVGFDPASYPLPLVDAEQAPKEARAQLWAVRRSAEAREVVKGVVERHGSRKKPRSRSRTTKAKPSR